MTLRRLPLTWSIYGLNAAWACFIYLLGPISPVLVDALGVPESWAGLLGTALALGGMTAGFLAPAVVGRIGRDATMRYGLAGTAIALTVLMALSPMLSGVSAFILVSALVWLTGACGITALNASIARLSDVHPEHSATVITEANAGAAWAGVLSPLLLGLALGAGLGWGAGVAVSLVAVLAALAGVVLAQRLGVPRQEGAVGDAPTADPDPTADPGPTADPDPTADPVAAAAPRGLGPTFWWAMVAVFAAVATEFGVNFWGSTLIREQTGAPTATATAAMSASVIGVALGRTVGPWLIARLGTHRTLVGGYAVALVGFAVLWSAASVGAAVGGLLLTGLGLSTLFPLLIDRGIVLSLGRADLAMSRASLVLSAAVGASPFALGALGAFMPVQQAFLLIPVVIGVGMVAAVRSRPSAVRSEVR